MSSPYPVLTRYEKSVLSECAVSLGMIKGLMPFTKMFPSGNPCTFSYPDTSVWAVSFCLNEENKCVIIEVNTTYWESTEKVKKVNSILLENGPLDIERLLTLIVNV